MKEILLMLLYIKYKWLLKNTIPMEVATKNNKAFIILGKLWNIQ